MLKKNSDFFILLIIWIISVISLIMGILHSYQIGLQSYVGYGLLILISFFRFIRIRRFKTIFGVFLILGSLNVFQFTVSTIALNFGWGKSQFPIGLQPLSLILLIFFVLINYPECRQFIDDLFSEDPKVIAQKEKKAKSKYHDALINEKDEKLQNIIENRNMYQVEYYNAAKSIMDERKQK
jgi:hypothetical protein